MPRKLLYNKVKEVIKNMKINIGVIFGGKSVEHEISIVTAIQAMDNIDKENNKIIPIYITKNLEWSILICTVLLVIIGLFAIYSATESTNHEEFRKQLIWIGISIPFLIGFTLIDYDTIAKVSPVLYGIIILALIAVLFTEPISGATSWFTFGSFSISALNLFASRAVIQKHIIYQFPFYYH